MRGFIARAHAVLLLAGGLSVAAGGAALAADGSPIVTTVNFHITQTLERTNLCTGDPVAITEDSNISQHITFFPSTGVTYVTFHEGDNLTGIDTITGVTYRGNQVNFGNLHTRIPNSSFAFTVRIHLKGSDGSTVSLHENSVFVVNPGGVNTVYFDHVSLDCT